MKNLSCILSGFAGESIDSDEITIGTFECTGEWGMTESMICREATYKDHHLKISQRGVLVFQPGLSRFVDINGQDHPFSPARIALLDKSKVTCAFSIANFNIPVETIIDGHMHRDELPCALVHEFFDDPAKSNLERMFQI